MDADERHAPPDGGRRGGLPGRIGPPLLAGLVVALMVVAILCITSVMQALDGSPADFKLIDFHHFYIAGTLAGTGRLAEAYDWARMSVLEDALGYSPRLYMPHAYPPPFDLLMAPLARLPIGTAYAAFAGGTFAWLIWTTQRLAGRWLWPAVLASAPAILIDVLIGQNGLLTAGLAGLAAGLALTGRSGAAGLAAGTLAALKPQTALALPLLFLLRRDWRAAAGMAAATAALYGAALLIVGPAIVPAWLTGLSDLGHSLVIGRLPAYRMTSIYACLLTAGAPSWVAMLAHGTVAAAVVAVTARTVRRSGDERAAAGLCLFATLFFSPYFFDYDLTILVPALGLVLPALARRSTPPGLGALLVVLAATGCFAAIEVNLSLTRISVSGPALLLCFLVVASRIGGEAVPGSAGGRRPGVRREAPRPAAT